MKILPVIHHLDAITTLEQATLAAACGVDGVFLISHTGANEEILRLVHHVRATFASNCRNGGEGWVGVNLLGMDPESAIEAAIHAGADAIWLDNAGVTSSGASASALRLSHFARDTRVNIKVFAGVAFKGQPEEGFPNVAAINARSLAFVPTTSGPATGQPPSLEKIAVMSRSICGCLAVASGLTPDNIAEFAPYLSHALVATGVSKDFHHLDSEKLQRFVQRARFAMDDSVF